MKVNKFPWTKVQTINEASPILHIKNAIPKPHALEIGQAIIDISKDPTYKDMSNLNTDSNSGCWRGKPHLSDHMTHEHKFFLSELMMACSLEYKETITKLVDGELKHRVSEDWQQATNRMVFDAWSNVNEPGSGNIAHSHSHNFLSGVVYFHSTGTGGINFQPQNYLMGSSHHLWPWHGVSRYEPDDGDVIIFPSYMVHDVESNPHESRQRVNMAFNARIMDMEPL